jgi:hypothetical protein
MNPQDFSRKMVIVLREDLQSWQLTNTVGHIAAYLGNKMQQSFDTGASFTDKDGLLYPRNSQYPIVALKASVADIKNVLTTARMGNFIWIAFTQDMIDTTDVAELAQAFEKKNSADIDILGIGIFGTKDDLKKLTGKLALWK